MIERRRCIESQDGIELQTLNCRQEPQREVSVSSTTSSTSRKSRNRLHKHPKRSKFDKSLRYPISSIDDEEGEIASKKESVQVEVHPLPICSKRNKTRSLLELPIKKTKKSNRRSDSCIFDPVFIAEHCRVKQKHFFKRPSIISLHNNKDQVEPQPSQIASERKRLKVIKVPNDIYFVYALDSDCDSYT